ncbi:MAG TPA: hypothetical protein VHS99_18110 [Chloroflexota bacterium]|nr:hypothetical protein [Chloroflexota bacterium]
MTTVFVHLGFDHMGISLDGFVAGVNRGPHNPYGHMGMKVHQWMFPAGVKPPRPGRERQTTARDPQRWMGGRGPGGSREQRARPTTLRGARVTERTSPSIVTVGRGGEEEAAPSNGVDGGAVLWAR